MDSSLNYRVVNALKNVSPPSSAEPAWILELFRSGIPELSRFLRKRYGGITGIQAVYCHSTPQVTFSMHGQPSRCELGDLLVVTSKLVSGGDRVERALLLQTKMDDKPASRSAEQDFLYTEWPDFTFVSAPRETRKPGFSAPHSGAQLGHFYRGGTPPSTSSPSLKVEDMGGTRRLRMGGQLVEMLADVPTSSRQVDLINPKADLTGWSQVVLDLLRTTFVRKKTIASTGIPRVMFSEGSSGASGFQAALLSELGQPVRKSTPGTLRPDDDPPNDENPSLDDERPDGPISAIVIEVDARDRDRN